MPQEVMINKQQAESSAPLPVPGAGKRIPLSVLEHSIRRFMGGSEQDPYRAAQKVSQLTELVQEAVLSVERPDASYEDYHNLAVSFAREDLFALACDVLEKGLQFFPYEPDLLGDYLNYSVQCGRVEMSKTVYKTLRKIPFRRWTWRAFTFSINGYLNYCRITASSEKDEQRLYDEMLMLIQEYHKIESRNEQVWSLEADVYAMFHEDQKVETTLEAGLAALGDGIAPRCAMRLAQIRHQQGRRAEALELIQRAIKENLEENESVNPSYLRFMEGLIRYSIAVHEESAFSEEQCEAIFTSFNAALEQDPHFPRSSVIRSKVKEILSQTHRKLDEGKYSALATCIRQSK